MADEMKQFIEQFLRPPKGDSPEQIMGRIRHWIDAAQHPEQFVGGDSSVHAIRAQRRNALQNLRRHLKKHPVLAKQVMAEAQTPQEEW
jgi:hypothetical protein